MLSVSENTLSFMRHAMELAERGRGFVSPNPVVGSVLVRDGKIIAEDWHREFGGGHAERNLLEAFSDEVFPDDVLYVTLEPCCVQGKTPACTDILLEKGVKKVVIGCWDPSLNKKSVHLLRERGVKVEVLEDQEGFEELADELRWQNRFFFKWVQQKAPWVCLKIAQSLDGRIVPEKGKQYWLTGKESGAHSHAARAQFDAIMVGAGTVIVDNPQLTVRNSSGQVVGPQPRVVLLDAALSIPLDSQVLRSGTIVVKGRGFKKRDGQEERMLDLGVEIVEVGSDRNGFLDLYEMLLRLGERGIASVYVDGGPSVWTSLLREELVDELMVYMAPQFLGGGLETFGDLGFDLGREFKVKEWEKLGDDVFLQLVPF